MYSPSEEAVITLLDKKLLHDACEHPDVGMEVPETHALGAAGADNPIVDRLRYAFVVDFVHVSWFPGIFNLADSAITIGVVMLASYLLFVGESAARPKLSGAGWA